GRHTRSVASPSLWFIAQRSVRGGPRAPGLPDRVGSRPPESPAVPTSGTRGGEWLKGTPYRGERYKAKSPRLGGGAPVRLRGARAAPHKAAPPRNTERQAHMTADTPEDRAQRANNAVADLLNLPPLLGFGAESPPVYDGSQTGFPTRAHLPIGIAAVSRDGQFAHVYFQSTIPGTETGLPGPEFNAPLRDFMGFDWEPVIPEPEPLPEPTLPSDDPPTTGGDGDDDGGSGGDGGSDPEPVGDGQG